MSLFSEQLSLALDTHGLSQTDLSSLTGIALAQINRYIKGRVVTISRKPLCLILDALPEQETRVKVLHAYLLDMTPIHFRKSVSLALKTKTDANQDPAADYLAQPDTPLSNTIIILHKEAITNPTLRDLLECIAKLF